MTTLTAVPNSDIEDFAIADWSPDYVYVAEFASRTMPPGLGTSRPLVSLIGGTEYGLLARPGAPACTSDRRFRLLTTVNQARLSPALRRYSEAGWYYRPLSSRGQVRLLHVIPMNPTAAVVRPERRYYAVAPADNLEFVVTAADDGCWVDENGDHRGESVLVTGIVPAVEDDQPALVEPTVEQVQAELAAFKAKVREAVIREGRERNWCSEADQWLVDLGLPPRVRAFNVAVTVAQTFTVSAEDEAAAIALVQRRMLDMPPRVNLSSGLWTPEMATAQYIDAQVLPD